MQDVSHGFGHQILHVSVLASTLIGAGGVILLLVWPLVSENPLPPATRNALVVMAIVALGLLVLEWRVVH
jgi:hypothetical protein